MPCQSRAAITDRLPTAAALALVLATAALYGAVALPLLSLHEPAQIGARGAATFVLASCALASTLVALSTIDALTFELPDILTLPLAASGVLFHLGHGAEVGAQQLLSAVAAYAILAGLGMAYRFMRQRDGLGLGDAKLCAAAAAWLGLQALPLVLALASAAALASVAVAALRSGGVVLSRRLPFGPYLSLSIWLVWLYGPEAASLVAP